MKSEWSYISLCEKIKFTNGKKRPLINGPIPVYGGNGILNFTNKANYKNCIIIGRVGVCCGNVYYEKGDCWVSDNAIVAIPNSEMNPKYVYYLLNYLKLNDLHIGSGQPLLTQGILNSVECNIPDRKAQDKIEKILSSVDDKIELNNKINKNLEQQAQAIYNDIFVVNADPLWLQGHLYDLVNVKYGKDHKKLSDGVYPVFGSGGIMRYVEHPLYDKESVLIPRKGTLNNIIYVNEPFWSVDTMFYTEMQKPNIAKFVYHFISSIDLLSMDSGSAVPSMTTDILNSIELRIPPDNILSKFEQMVSPMYNKIKINNYQSKLLSSIRDILLPKLMNGEIEI